MKRTLIGLLVAVSFFSGNVWATEYIHRELMANTLPPPKCEAKADAMANASKQYNLNRFSKKFCQTQGYGWHVEEIKDNGKVVCEECPGAVSGVSQCHLEDVVVSCKRIKPGSVGMLPGKS
jgi:hypothetical protein